MTEPVDMILPLLREMRASNEAMHEKTHRMFSTLEKRMEKLEQAQQSFKQALTADTLLSRLLTGEFEERIEALEKKVFETGVSP